MFMYFNFIYFSGHDEKWIQIAVINNLNENFVNILLFLLICYSLLHKVFVVFF